MTQITPQFITIDPITGAIGADFSGHLHAAGIDLDFEQSAAQNVPISDLIRWIRPSDSLVGGLLRAYNKPLSPAVASRIVQQAIDPDDPLNYAATMLADAHIGSGVDSGHSMISFAVSNGVTAQTVKLIRDDGISDFVLRLLGFARIFDLELGASAGSIDTGANGVDQTFQHLLVMTSARSDRAIVAEDALLRFNGDTTAAYSWEQAGVAAAAITASEAASTTGGIYGAFPAATIANAASTFGVGFIFLPNYRKTDRYKPWIGFGGAAGSTAANSQFRIASGIYRSTNAITRVQAAPSVGPNYVAGSRMTIYGIG